MGELMVKSYIIGLIILLVLVAGCSKNEEQVIISSFQECVDAGHPVLESYPAQCTTPDGYIFYQELLNWNEDGIILMKNPETGEVSCFGSNGTILLSPEIEFEIVGETEERHCLSSFEIKE